MPASGQKQQLIDRILARSGVLSERHEEMPSDGASDAVQHHDEILRDLEDMDKDSKNDGNNGKICSNIVDEQIENNATD